MRCHSTWMLGVLFLWMSCPSRAHAHLVNSGLGPFYDGFAHLLVTPEDLLTVIALALLGGLGGKRCGRAVLLVLPVAWLVGTFAGRIAFLSAGVPLLSAGLLIALGTLVAADWRLPLPVVAGVALTCGLLHGCFNGTALASAGSSGLAVAGITGAVFMTVALLAGQAASLKRDWARIAFRVAGSWIGAIGLLMLGWAVRQARS